MAGLRRRTDPVTRAPAWKVHATLALPMAAEARPRARPVRTPTTCSRTAKSTGPEIWRQTQAASRTSSVSMGTTGTIMGVSRLIKEAAPHVQVTGACSRRRTAQILGIRRWPEAHLPKIYEAPARRSHPRRESGRCRGDDPPACAREGLFCGISAAARWSRRCASPPKPRTRWIVSIVLTAATGICRPACLPDRPDLAVITVKRL